MSVPDRDGTTRSNLCLYMLFRLFTGTVIVCALRLARQVCTASRRKLAAASRPTAREAADRHGAPKAKGTRLRVPFAFGASDGTRTRDLVLTKDALYLLSYTSLFRCLRPFRGRFLIIGCVFAYVNCFCLNSFYKFAMMAYNTIHSGVSPSQGD